MQPCSHVWIDPKDAPIARGSYAPVVGLLRRQMKAGTDYQCQNCGETLAAERCDHKFVDSLVCLKCGVPAAALAPHPAQKEEKEP